MTSSDISQEKSTVFAETYPYQIFDENGVPILPCENRHCVDKDGKPYCPIPMKCARVKCEKIFRPVCPAMIYCRLACFEATKTHASWHEAKKCLKKDVKSERKKRLAKDRHKKYMNTASGREHKSEQNKRCYERRKEAGKTHEVYEKIKAIRSETCTRELTKSEPPQTPEPTVRKTICSYPGCDEVILHDRTFWGNERKFCSKKHREKMLSQVLRLKRLSKIMKCPFIMRVLVYLRLASEAAEEVSNSNFTVLTKIIFFERMKGECKMKVKICANG